MPEGSFFQASSASSYAAMAFKERFAVARGFYLADAGNLRKSSIVCGAFAAMSASVALENTT